MKKNSLVPNGTTNGVIHHLVEELGDAHIGNTVNTPLRDDAFEITDDEKIETIAHHFRAIMETIGLDMTDDSLKGTPHRVAKMYVKEIFKGLKPENLPKPTMFENHYGYQRMLVEKDIAIYSTCEHHFLPIFGKCHIAYISSGHVIGLSKLNRIAQYYAKRPQVQERLTRQIAEELKRVLQTESVMVYIDARHFCVHARGVEDHSSSTVTMDYSGEFLNQTSREEFLRIVHAPTKP